MLVELIRKYGSLILLSLLLFSVALIGVHQLNFEKTYTVDVQSKRLTYAISDSDPNNGSLASTIIKDNQRIMHCKLVNKSDHPFCELIIELIPLVYPLVPKGVDFSKFDRVGIWLKFDSQPSDTVRFRMRHFDTSYSSLESPETFKFNTVEWFPSINDEKPIWFELDKFQVDAWWMEEMDLPIEHMGSELSNIVSLSIAISSKTQPGDYTLVLDKIEFRGHWIASEDLYLGILIVWFVTAMTYLTGQYFGAKKVIHSYKEKTTKLATHNQLLDEKNSRLSLELTQDELTGALNREGLNRLLLNNEATLNALVSLSIAYIDIDHFKRVNDTKGHPFGDVILQEFSQLLSDSIRDSELLARWGGEEFILACPNLDANQVEPLLDKLRKLVENHTWPDNYSLTCSIGYAQRQADETIEQLIERADQALYQAKSTGRNKVCFHSTET